MTGLATLGFSGGPSVTFRLNPNSVDWNWTINTSVTPTIGGRVIQVLGATLDDVVIQGDFGQSRGDGPDGESWLLAESFYKKIRDIMEWQSRDATIPAKMHQPAVFNFPLKNWRFAVYVKDLSDPDGGGSVTHSIGKFAHRYALTLFIVEELSDSLVKAGTSHGVLNDAKAKAIDSYLSRISDGIGWKFSKYNGNANPSVNDLPSASGSAQNPNQGGAVNPGGGSNVQTP